MPRRPGGGSYEPASLEAALRELAMGEGPDVRRLGQRSTPGFDYLMRKAATPPLWGDPEVAATAVLQLIGQEVDGIANPHWRSAAHAALRLPAEDYVGAHGVSLAQRLKRRAELDRGNLGDEKEASKAKEAYRGYWISCAQNLAERLGSVLEQMARDSTSWDRFARAVPESPPLDLPISFAATDVLYTFSGRVGVRSTSYRWLVAHAPVDHYDAVGWYYNEPDAKVDIVPLANCEVNAPIRDLPSGGRTARLDFAHTLSNGEEYFFAYSAVFNSTNHCRPTILYEVRGRQMNRLMVRVQFDRLELPALCWFFDVESQSEGWEEPDVDAAEILSIASNGYVQWEFRDCRRGRKYGLRWQWQGG